MKNKIRPLLATVLAVLLLAGCGEDPELVQFRNYMENFCTKISEIDTSINSIDAQSDTAVNDLLSCLDELDNVFQSFAEHDFPEEFDYLEELADKSGEYMEAAVSGYHETYKNGGYDESMAEYARENYSRAYKCIQVIITYLHGDRPEASDLSDSED